MKKIIRKIICLIRYKRINKITPISILQDCVDQLSAIYYYINGDDYKDSQRDILNLRIAELSFKINEQLKYVTRRNSRTI